jgi:putative ABC transport system substrate-binding protein
VALEFRWAESQVNRLPALAAELVHRRVSLLVTAGGAAAPAAKAATTIPIVFSTGSDPVRVGLVHSLSRPGGNLTGTTTLSRELGARRLGILRDLVPGDAPFALMIASGEPDADSQIADVQEAARQIGRQLLVLRIRAGSDAEIEAAFATMAARGLGGYITISTAILLARAGFVSALATRYGLPAVYGERAWALAGGLMEYSTSFIDSYHNVGVYAGRILKGAKPADLPILEPTKFEFVINLNAAKAIRLAIPSGILAIADEVIE